jgi:phage-related protein
MRVLENEFGDQYRQRSMNGINNRAESWDLEFIGSTSTIDDIEDFFYDRNGYEAFDWTPPGEAVSKKWTCKEWTRTKIGSLGSGTDSISATFRREYDL